MNRWLTNGYNRRSLVVLAVLFTAFAAVGTIWWKLLYLNRFVVDGWFVAIWLFMIAMLCWDPQPAKDLPLALVAMAGGLTIEWWGTHTGLWVYFTRERPPLWILVAWPVSTLAIDRIYRALDRFAPRGEPRWRLPYWIALPVFVATMTRFAWPTMGSPITQGMIGLMVVVTISGRTPRRDVVLLVAGSLLGVFLETWGTSHYCWTYYTREVPPPVTACAHGFASVVFVRVVPLLRWALPFIAPRAGLTLSGKLTRRSVSP
jgi:hypothetical protein